MSQLYRLWKLKINISIHLTHMSKETNESFRFDSITQCLSDFVVLSFPIANISTKEKLWKRIRNSWHTSKQFNSTKSASINDRTEHQLKCVWISYQCHCLSESLIVIHWFCEHDGIEILLPKRFPINTKLQKRMRYKPHRIHFHSHNHMHAIDMKIERKEKRTQTMRTSTIISRILFRKRIKVITGSCNIGIRLLFGHQFSFLNML